MQNLEIAVHALQRSGHHAVIEWLLAILRRKHGLNNVLFINWINERSMQVDPFNYEGRDLAATEAPTATKDTRRNVLIYNFEDAGTHMLYQSALYGPRYVGDSGVRLNVIVLRDCYNMLASRYHRATNHDRPFSNSHEAAVGMWLDQARMFLNSSGMPDGVTSPICISYNQWFSSDEYRRGVALAVAGCNSPEEPASAINHFGFGSSFDGFEGDARSMDVLHRWKCLRYSTEYQRLVDNPAIARYNDELFGWHLEFAKGYGDVRWELCAVPYRKSENT